MSISLTGCQDDVVVKTPGEITGEKIMELVNTNQAKAVASFVSKSANRNYEFSFYIEGQFLYAKHPESKQSFDLVFDLNHLTSFFLSSIDKVFTFYFDE